MRVLQVLSSLNIGSGIANFVMSYYRKMVCKGVQFDFLLFTPMEKDFTAEVEKLGGRVYFIPKLTLNFGRYNKDVKRFFKEHKGEWDIVHIHEILVQRFICKNSKRYGGVKGVVTHAHAAKLISPQINASAVKNKFIMCFKSLRNAVLLQGINRNSDLYFACSEEAGKTLFGAKSLSDSKFHIIKNAIETEKYLFNEDIRKLYRKEFKVEDRKVIMLVGRLSEEKNPVFILNAFKTVYEVDNKYFLIFVGDGHLKGEIINLSVRLGIEENILLLGNRSDVHKVLQSADIFVIPSLAEGLGIALIEAQTSGLPCIASTGVPKEAQITPYVQFLDLDINQWVNAILKTDLVRYDTLQYVKNNGYDVDTNIECLYKQYLTLSGN